MPEFARRWNNFPAEVGVPPLTELTEPPYGSSVSVLQGTFSEKTRSLPASDALSDHLLSRLQTGSQWLSDQHRLWLAEDPDAATDERFSVALDGWAEMERSLRLVYGYEDCISGLDQRCPENAPVRCDGCLG